MLVLVHFIVTVLAITVLAFGMAAPINVKKKEMIAPTPGMLPPAVLNKPVILLPTAPRSMPSLVPLLWTMLVT